MEGKEADDLPSEALMNYERMHEERMSPSRYLGSYHEKAIQIMVDGG